MLHEFTCFCLYMASLREGAWPCVTSLCPGDSAPHEPHDAGAAAPRDCGLDGPAADCECRYDVPPGPDGRARQPRDRGALRSGAWHRLDQPYVVPHPVVRLHDLAPDGRE